MDVASLVIRARPADLEAVHDRLGAMPGVEVVAAAPDGRLVVVVEDHPGASFDEALVAIHRIEDVLSATLVYQYSDAIPESVSESTEAAP